MVRVQWHLRRVDQIGIPNDGLTMLRQGVLLLYSGIHVVVVGKLRGRNKADWSGLLGSPSSHRLHNLCRRDDYWRLHDLDGENHLVAIIDVPGIVLDSNYDAVAHFHSFPTRRGTKASERDVEIGGYVFIDVRMRRVLIGNF